MTRYDIPVTRRLRHPVYDIVSERYDTIRYGIWYVIRYNSMFSMIPCHMIISGI